VPETGDAAAAEMTGIGLRMLNDAEPETVGEGMLTAETVTVFVVGIDAGGV
jgi:hypothetical protein